ncbi:hypothetical protein ANN_17737, partial [Periplaneta americana]
ESSDEELDYHLLQYRERPKNENYFEETVPRYNAQEFMEHFRVSRQVAEGMAEKFSRSEYFHHQAGGNGKLGPLQFVLIFLWFVGHQTSSFRDVADRFNVTISTLFRVVRRMMYFVSNLSEQIIMWPTADEIVEIQQYFRHNHFPGVIGITDGTHIRIDRPKNDPDSYLNRKHFYSVQLQAVCDHKMKIRDVFVGFPGSVHDSRVFRRSPLSESLPQKCHHLYLLGDSGYPCLENLLTPFRDRGNLRRAEREFNTRLSKNRYLIEHCFGLLKQKFRQLYHVKLKNIRDIVHLIRACCVLHNIVIDDHFQYEAGAEMMKGYSCLLQ